MYGELESLVAYQIRSAEVDNFNTRRDADNMERSYQLTWGGYPLSQRTRERDFPPFYLKYFNEGEFRRLYLLNNNLQAVSENMHLVFTFVKYIPTQAPPPPEAGDIPVNPNPSNPFDQRVAPPTPAPTSAPVAKRVRAKRVRRPR